MSDPAFDRYREAIRRGHMAASGGDHEGALVAFSEAADLAPDRPLPQVGRGVALHRAGRLAEALEAFERATQVAPLDEAALRGRSAVLVAMGRSGDAAAILTGLAESLEADGRFAEALELGREALALASSAARFRMVARLSASVRRPLPNGDDDGAGDSATGGTDPASAGAGSVRETAARAIAEGDLLVAEGRLEAASERYLAAAQRYRNAGQRLAALDACLVAMSIAPADPDLHLVLVEIYREQGWSALAIDKLVLLARLLELQGDHAARARICELAARAFPEEPRLLGVCPDHG